MGSPPSGPTRTALRPIAPRAGHAGAPPALEVSRGAVTGRAAVHQLAVLAGYIAAGVAATWPLATYLRGRLPDLHDPASYVWSLGWVAHQVTHLANPWFTSSLAAPVGLQLGYDTLMPLLGLVMLPITLLAGPAVSYNLLVVLLPGVLCYVMYRAARLWITSEVGAVASGALFGLSTMVAFQDWFHLNIAAGTVFLPLALEAAVRLRRRPGIGRAWQVGLVLGLAVLVNQESAIMAAILVLLALIPWVAGERSLGRFRDCGIAALTALVVASPQIAAMAWQSSSGGTAVTASTLPAWYRRLGVGLPAMFSPSPRLRSWGLGALAGGFHFPLSEGVPTFGITLSVLALAGLVISWRRPHTRPLGLLWLGSVVLAMGSAVKIGNTSYLPAAISAGQIRLSGIMPFTWLVHVPGLSAFREADRFTLLGLVPAALLAGTTVGWLARRARPLLGRPAQAGLRSVCARPGPSRPVCARPGRSRSVRARPGEAPPGRRRPGRRRRAQEPGRGGRRTAGHRGPRRRTGGRMARRRPGQAVHARVVAGPGRPDRRRSFRLDRGGRAVRHPGRAAETLRRQDRAASPGPGQLGWSPPGYLVHLLDPGPHDPGGAASPVLCAAGRRAERRPQ